MSRPKTGSVRARGRIECSTCVVLSSLVEELRALWQDERERGDKLSADYQAQLAALLSKHEPPTPVAATGRVARFPRPATPETLTDPRVVQPEPAFSQPPDVLARLQDLQFQGRHAPVPGRAMPDLEPPPSPAEEEAANAAIVADVDDIAVPGAAVALE